MVRRTADRAVCDFPRAACLLGCWGLPRTREFGEGVGKPVLGEGVGKPVLGEGVGEQGRDEERSER